MTRNEVREREDMEPLDGLDKPLEPLNMAPAGQRDNQPPQDRQQALLQGAATRAVTREVRAVRRLVAESGGVAWVSVGEFYGLHADFVSEALACDHAAAAAWCDARHDALRAADDAGALLDQWETEGAEALKGLMQ